MFHGVIWSWRADSRAQDQAKIILNVCLRVSDGMENNAFTMEKSGAENASALKGSNWPEVPLRQQ